MRLCLVGKEKVGKTTLAHTLLGLSPPEDKRTMGIEIKNVTINGKDFTLWDFAGTMHVSLSLDYTCVVVAGTMHASLSLVLCMCRCR